MEKNQLITLVSSLQKGEQEAAGSLYDAYYNDVYYFILKIVKDPHLAADLTQDTFVEILETIQNLRIPSAFPSWCKMIAYHKCTAYFKKRKDLLADEKTEEYYLLDKRTEKRIEFLPDESVDEDELKRTICSMLDALPEEQRAAILMRYYDEISIKDIAALQKVSEGTVKSRLNYGRKALKEAVIEYEKKNNIKLHCRGVIPLLLWFFKEDRLEKGISLSQMTPFAETIASVTEKATKTFVRKVFAAIVTSLLVTSGVSTAATLNGKTADSVPDISTEAELNESHGNAETDNNANTTEQATDESTTLDTEENSSEDSNVVINPLPPADNNASEDSEASSTAILDLTLSNDGSYYIVSGVSNCVNAQVTIPSEYNGIPVTAIGDSAFKGNSDLTSITLPNSITHIGNEAFFSTGLREITIPNSVASIGESAFASNNELASVTLSNNITSIANYTFYGCVSLSSITIPKSISYIGQDAFSTCPSLTKINVENGNPTYHSSGNCIIETASKTLIAGCSTSTIPLDGSVTTIGINAFFGMSNLTSITIPEGVTTIKNQAFDYCTRLTSIYLPASVTEITGWVFENCSNLSHVYYAGTMEQWNAYFPNLEYLLPSGRTCVVHCSDGDITNP